MALIAQVHEGLNSRNAQKKASAFLKSLDISHLSLLRYNKCEANDIFYVQLARAAMLDDDKIILDQPLSFLAQSSEKSFIYEALERLNISYDRVIILDLIHLESFYKEGPCHIEKLS